MIFDLRKKDLSTIEGLKTTPSAALGSCRYKVKNEGDYGKILSVFEKYRIKSK